VQVRAADGAGGDPEQHVGRLLQRGVGHLRQGDLAGPGEHDGFHGVSSGGLLSLGLVSPGRSGSFTPVRPAQAAASHSVQDDLLADARDGGQVTGHHVFRTGKRRAGVRRAGAVTGVQHDLVPLPRQHLPGHQAEAVRRSGEENPSHD